jgi:hypothetical protein
MKAFKLALAGVLMLCALVPASARDVEVQLASGRSATFIKDDPGGKIVDFVKKYSDMRDAGTQVVIDGECVSACTLIISMLQPENVCVTPDASLGFHSASVRIEEEGKEPRYEHAQEMSELMYDTYPGRVRAYLSRKGWTGPNAHPSLIWVKGKQLRKFIRRCTAADLS